MLSENLDLNKLLLRSVMDYAIYLLDAEGRVVLWNAGAERVMRYSASEVVGRHFSSFYVPEDRAAEMPNKVLIAAEREGRIESEGWRLRADGSRFWASALIYAVRDESGALQGYAKVTRDLTERYDAQRRLAHLQRLEALGQLASGIAHDFNNVLQAVQGGASLLEQRVPDREDVSRLVRVIQVSAERGSAITRRLLAFSRRGDLGSDVVDPTTLFADLREILVHTLGAGIRVQIEPFADLPNLYADKGQLETVLVNLATNARDAMNGLGTLTLSAGLETVTVADPRMPVPLVEGEYVRLSLSDTGTGMTPEVLSRVREPFFTTKPDGQGTGLGLAMAHGFAQQSRGGLHIESAEGLGTTVSLWLPVAEKQSIGASPVEPADQAQVHPLRVLLVDDDVLVREMLAEQLRLAGYIVQTATDAAAGLVLLNGAEPVELLISNLSMPNMDGLGFVRDVQRRYPDLPTILLTGFASQTAEIALSGLLSGRFAVLRKPVSIEGLITQITMLSAGLGRVGIAQNTLNE